MIVHDDQSLLAPDEPAAFRVVCAPTRSPFFLTCDHAGALVPPAVDAQERQRSFDRATVDSGVAICGSSIERTRWAAP
jgi:hypothetical protein